MLRLKLPILLLAGTLLAACQSTNSMTAGAGGAAQDEIQYDGYSKQQHDNDGMSELERRHRWQSHGRGR